MKYKIRKTNEIVDVVCYSECTHIRFPKTDFVCYIDNEGNEINGRGLNLIWDFEPLDETQNINWQFFHNQAAKVIPFANYAIIRADSLTEALKEEKPAWSGEDERILNCLIKDQKDALDEVRNSKSGHIEIISDLKEMYRERINWLKFLKERYTWKPSKEQIIALRWVLNNVPYNKHKEEISGLLDQIKNL